jgi:hypothetical protein
MKATQKLHPPANQFTRDNLLTNQLGVKNQSKIRTS